MPFHLLKTTDPDWDERPVHVLMPSEQYEEILREILRCSDQDVSVLDLSVGNFHVPSQLGNAMRRLIDESDEFNVHWLDAQALAPELGDASRAAFVEWTSHQASKDIHGKKSLKEWFVYQGDFSLWWLSAVSQKMQEVTPIRWMIFAHDVINSTLNSGHSDQDERGSGPETSTLRVTIWGEDDEVTQSVGNMVAARGHDVRIGGLSRSNPGRPTIVTRPVGSESSRRNYLTSILYSLRMMLAAILRLAENYWIARKRARSSGSAFPTTDDDSTSLRVLLATDFPRLWHRLPPEERFERDVAWMDRYFDAAPWRLQEKGVRVAWLPTFGSQKDFEVWKQIRGAGLPDAVEKMTVHWTKILGIVKHLVLWTIKYIWLFEIKRVDQRIAYKDLPLGHWVRHDYRNLASFSSAAHLFTVEQFRCAFESLSPDVVLYTSEFYSLGRKIAAVAPPSTRLVACQHGMLHREDTVYQFSSRDVDVDASTFVDTCPMPDICTVFGSNTVKWFRSWGGYPPHRVIATGGLRQDRLVERYSSDGALGVAPHRNSIRNALGWPVGRPVVLLCTAFWRDVASHFELTMAGCRSLDVVPHVAVKLHPLHPASEAVHETAGYLGVTDYSVFTDGQVYDMIHAADLLVTCTSTVIVEAELLSTPTIVISAHRDYPLHVPDGCSASPSRPTAALSGHTVSNFEEMKAALHRAFRNGGIEPEDHAVTVASMANAEDTAWMNLLDVIHGRDLLPQNRYGLGLGDPLTADSQ